MSVRLAILQYRERAPRLALLGGLTARSIVAGTGEGVAMALGHSEAMFWLATIVGFPGLGLWLIATGAMLIVRPAPGHSAVYPADFADHPKHPPFTDPA